MSSLSSADRVVLATWFPRDAASPHGGVEAVSVVLAQALAAQKNCEIHVVTLDPTLQTTEISQWGDVIVHRLPRGRTPLFWFVAGAGGRLVRKYIEGLSPTLVHAHDTFGIITCEMSLSRILTIHGFIHEDTLFQGGAPARLRAVYWKRLELEAWARYRHIISISPYVKERLKDMADAVIHEIENPVDARFFHLKREEETGTIFSAASICERKNTLGLVRSFAKLKQRGHNYRLKLVGPITEPAYGRKLSRLIADEQLGDSIELMGAISREHVRAELGRASLFALLSLEEGAPMVIAEAMAAGVPVVASNRCGMPYMIDHGETGFLVEPDESDDVADHLDQILSDTTLRSRMNKASRELARRRFHPDRVAERTLEAYQVAADSIGLGDFSLPGQPPVKERHFDLGV
jgi:glycosyltransferase involved in cell wall biosynthesis